MTKMKDDNVRESIKDKCSEFVEETDRIASRSKCIHEAGSWKDPTYQNYMLGLQWPNICSDG